MVSKVEIKLFISFFLIFFLFIHWIGPGENTRLALTRAITDQSRLEIDSYIRDTEDRAIYKNHYYTISPPGMSFFAIPTYSVWKFIYHNFFPTNFINANVGTNEIIPSVEKIVTFVDPGFFIRNSMIFIIIFTSSTFGALSIVLTYKILHFFTKNKSYIFLTTFIFGFATLAFHLSLVFFGSITAIFLSLFAFYLILKNKTSAVSYLIAGIFIGLSILVEYSPTIIAFFFFILVFYYNKKNSLWFLLGIFIGTLPLISYNYVIFKNPFELTSFHLDPQFWHLDTSGKENILLFYSRKIVYDSYNLLFGTYRGLFFYYPIILFSIFGLWYFYRKMKIEAIIIFLIFISYLLFNSFLPWWWSSSPGPRHLMPSIAFLSFPLVYVLDKIKTKKLLLLIFIFTLAASIFHVFISLQEAEGPNYVFNYQTKQYELSRRFNNPLYEHYLPLSLKDGLRSRILEGLLTNVTKTDIRGFQFQPTSGIKFVTTPFGFLTFRMQTLPIALVVLLVFLMWRKEIIWLNLKKYCVAYVILVLIIILTLDLQTIAYGDNFYPISKNETYTSPYRWMSQNATIYLFSPKDGNLFLNSSIISFNKTRKLDLYLNGDLKSSYNIRPQDYLGLKLDVKKGKNIIKLYSSSDCDKPSELYNSSDVNCLTFGFEDLRIFTSEELMRDGGTFFGENWYLQFKNETYTSPYRWMSQNATIYLFSNSRELVLLNVSDLWIFGNKTLDFYLNDNFIENFDGSWKITGIYLNKDENILKLNSKEGCERPIDVEKNSSDMRCLSFAFLVNKSIVIKSEELINKNNTLVFDHNWYSEEKIGNISFRWMSQNATIYVINPSLKNQQFDMKFVMWSYYKSKKLEIGLGNTSKEIDVPKVPSSFSIGGLLKPGINVLKLTSLGGCDIPLKSENSSDERCLGFAMGNFVVSYKADIAFKIRNLYISRNVTK